MDVSCLLGDLITNECVFGAYSYGGFSSKSTNWQNSSQCKVMFFIVTLTSENESFPKMIWYNEGITLKSKSYKIVALCGVEEVSLLTG